MQVRAGGGRRPRQTQLVFEVRVMSSV